MKKALILLSLSLCLSGCATTPPSPDRSGTAADIASRAGFNKEYISSGIFTLMTYRRYKAPSETIRIYIEGDGRAWKTRSRLSDDPTPSNPVALDLAAADPSDAVAYIARPGQFPSPDSAECDPKYWSELRFAPEVVEAFDGIIDILKEKSGADEVELVGYSGGGALAVLLAARRIDVASLRTVAGNLDLEASSAYHNVSRLEGSMDPVDVAENTAYIPQRHFVGSKDKVIPPSVAKFFVKREGNKSFGAVTIVEGASHSAGWRERWEKLLLMPLITCSEE